MNDEDFMRHLQHMDKAEIVAIDTEGTLNHPHSETWGMSYSANGLSGYFPFNHKISSQASGENLSPDKMEKLAKVVENLPCIIMHNAKHDLRALRNLGINYNNRFYDTRLMFHMIDENDKRTGLDYVSRKYGGEPKNMPQIASDIIKSLGWPYVPVNLMSTYADNDAVITEDLFWKLLPQFQEEQFDGEYWDWEQEFIRAIANLEDVGLLIDQNFCEQEYEKGLAIMNEITKDLGFNPGSPAQLGKFLLEDLNLAPSGRKTKGGKHSFDAKAMKYYDLLLSQMNNDAAKKILTYKGWAKVTGSSYKPYLTKLGPDGRFRSQFNIDGTRTGRMSCGYLQQIPRESEKPWNGKLKRAFIAAPGRIRFEADYSQLELRLGAAYGNVTNLIEVLNDRDRDVFTEIAKQVGGMSRQDVKTQSYTLQFAGGIKSLRETFGISYEEAKERRDNWYRTYPGLRHAANKAEKLTEARGYVRNWAGRRRHFLYVKDEAHKAFSAAIQGGAFEIVKRITVNLHREGIINEECKADLQVHDSLGFDIERGKEHIYKPEIQRVMENVSKEAGLLDFGVNFYVKIKEWGTSD